jgi:hypothetical protein
MSPPRPGTFLSVALSLILATFSLQNLDGYQAPDGAPAVATGPPTVQITGFQENPALTGSALMQAVDKESSDASVKALTQFPVLDNLARNLAWTSSLGEAYHNQSAEVMTIIRTLRAASPRSRKSQVDSSNHRRTAGAPDDRDAAGRPADRARFRN